MAPRLAVSQLILIRDMLISGEPLTASQIAEAAGCSERSVKNIRSNLRLFGSVRAPPNRVGRRRSITPVTLEALCDHLLEKPGLYLDEMALFIWDEFDTLTTTSTISRALTSIGWSKKTIRRKAREQNVDLRDSYLHDLSEFHSYHLVYIDESGCDKRIGFRRTGWSPLGVAPVQISRFHRGQRYQILPVYAQDGIVLSRVFQVPLMRPCMKISLNSFSSIVGNGQSQSPSWSWTTHLFIVLNESNKYARTEESN